MSANSTFGLVAGLIGGLLVLLAVFFYMRTRSFIGRAKEAKGTVIQMVYRRNSSDSDSGGGYSAVYQFRTLDGQTIAKQDSLSSNPPRFKVGQQIDVLYEPGDPNKAQINNWMSLYFLPALLGGLGLISGGVGIAIAFPRVLEMLGV
ncbi:MAG: DUF3592 domain-containing protein [Chloroflexota bacterium]